MLVKNTVIALLAAAPAFALPAATKAEKAVAPAQAAAKIPVKTGAKETSKSIQQDLSEKKAKFAKLEKTENAAIAKEETLFRTVSQREKAAAAKEKATTSKQAGTKKAKTSAEGGITEHLHPNSHKLKRPAGLRIKTDNLKSHKHKLSPTGTPGTGRSRKSLKSAGLHSPHTPGTGRSHNSHRHRLHNSHRSHRSHKSHKSHKSHSGTPHTPGTGRSHRSQKSLKSAGLNTPSSARTPGLPGTPSTPGTGRSSKSLLQTPTSARTPSTPGSALKSAASLKSAAPESPIRSPMSPPFSDAALSPGMQEHIKWTPTANGGYDETVSVDAAPKTPARLSRRADVPATPASATPPAASVVRTHRHSRKLQHKHTAGETLQLNAMLLQAEKLVNGLEDQMNKPHTTFPNMKRKMRKLHISKVAVKPTTPTTPTKPAA